MKFYIDVGNAELITLGYEPEIAREMMNRFGLRAWSWVDVNRRAIPASWEPIWIEDSKLPCPFKPSTIET
jgi:hypothetical protein